MKSLLALITALAMTSANPDPSIFIKAALDGLQQQTSAHSATWRLGQEQDWAADLEAGTIVFTFADGVTATAAIQVVGTYNTLDATFLWGWDHPSVPEKLRKHAMMAKQWGETNKVSEFTQRKVKCTEDDAWKFAAVANRLANANGVYRGPSGTTMVFMTFGEIKLQKAGKQ